MRAPNTYDAISTNGWMYGCMVYPYLHLVCKATNTYVLLHWSYDAQHLCTTTNTWYCELLLAPQVTWSTLHMSCVTCPHTLHGICILLHWLLYLYTGMYSLCVLMGYYMLLRMYAPPVTLLVWLVLLGEQMLQLYPQMLTLGHCITWDGVTYALATSCGQVLH